MDNFRFKLYSEDVQFPHFLLNRDLVSPTQYREAVSPTLVRWRKKIKN